MRVEVRGQLVEAGSPSRHQSEIAKLSSEDLSPGDHLQAPDGPLKQSLYSV